MPSVRYIGPHDEVDLPTLGLFCKSGDVIEVSDDVVAGLADQTSWELVPAAAAAAKTAPVESAPAQDGN